MSHDASVPLFATDRITMTRHRGGPGALDEPIATPRLAVAVVVNAGHHVRLSTSVEQWTSRAMAFGDCNVFAPHDPHRAEWNDFVDVVRVEIEPRSTDDLRFAPRLQHRDDAFVRLVHACLAPRIASEPLIRDALAHAVAGRAFAMAPRPAGTRTTVRGGLDARELVIALEFIAAYAHADIRLADIAAATGLSPFHFARMFAVSTGTTPHAYIVDLRLARSCASLRRGVPVATAAAHVGFTSPTHFADAFRRKYAVSPSQFARSAQDSARPAASEP